MLYAAWAPVIPDAEARREYFEKVVRVNRDANPASTMAGNNIVR
jgi:hypothetical protein